MKHIYLIPLFTLLLFSCVIHSQNRYVFVAAKNGLSIREKPAIGAKVVDKIPYGAKITLMQTQEAVSINTEGMTGYWEKVNWNNKTGFVVSSYLLPVAPPKLAVVKEMEDYFKQVYVPFGAKLKVKEGERFNIEEGGYEQEKQLYKNGAEWHRFMGYEYGSDTWFLPDFTLQQGFILLRLIPEFKDVFGDGAVFPTESKTIKAGDREFIFTVEKEMIGDSPWIKKIIVEYEDGALYNLELFQMENQLVIQYSSGV